MEVTAQMVKDLRSVTGAGIMDCKEALKEKDGDLEEAKIYLREKGLSSAAKKAGRAASDGLVESDVASDGRSGVLVEVNCETDFVAKTEDFSALVGKVISHVTENGKIGEGGVEALQGEVTAAITKLGENIVVSRGDKFEVPGGQAGAVSAYIHPGGAIGVMVELHTSSEDVVAKDGFAEVAKDLAMHIAASSPLYLQADQVPGSLIESERAILLAQSQDTGKPEEIVAKIVEGRINKYLKEVCLMDQPFVKDPDQKIQGWMSSKSKELGGEIEISRFARFQRGELSTQEEAE
ncbi:MAG: elongation factor Ts [Nitrospinaceae bacterium]|nr:elongation factor Ts [Nitrospinaceae bacterium]MBT3432581.1 elongation factor Ts [Nitrospinaceae bacterium]MBT3822093.1 elongation factor Ts [Nitrospinaceae bacterium]MBT4095604.1 elongation factor Ts [Nitrospinaceae bacterium]MBT4429661.1 elongation factor Ts [Nitrospinaceae bacterium]